MNIESFRDYCLSLPEVTEELPFDDKVLVFKVCGKIFALTDLSSFESLNLKCDPDKALELRSEFEQVQPGYHMNKKHWNTFVVDDRLSDEWYLKWIRHSYLLVVQKLKAKDRNRVLKAL